MWIWERSRGLARYASIMLAFGVCAGRSGATAEPGPAPVVVDDAAPLRAAPGANEPFALPRVIEPTASYASNEPFALPRVIEPTASYASKWRDILAAIDRDRAILAECRLDPDRCVPGAPQLLDIVAAAQAKDGRARLGEVNRAINLTIRYQSDLAQYGASDAWASPLVTMASGRGDCEDYAIAKYLALREANVAADDLRLVVVRDTRRREDHAVLTVRLDDRWLVLDNSRLLLLEDRELRDYVPVIALGPDTDRTQVAENPAGVAGGLAPAFDAAVSESDPS